MPEAQPAGARMPRMVLRTLQKPGQLWAGEWKSVMPSFFVSKAGPKKVVNCRELVAICREKLRLVEPSILNHFLDSPSLFGLLISVKAMECHGSISNCRSFHGPKLRFVT